MKIASFVLTTAFVAAMAVATISAAWAACPPGTSYQCTQGLNGKVICGCR